MTNQHFLFPLYLALSCLTGLYLRKVKCWDTTGMQFRRGKVSQNHVVQLAQYLFLPCDTSSKSLRLTALQRRCSRGQEGLPQNKRPIHFRSFQSPQSGRGKGCQHAAEQRSTWHARHFPKTGSNTGKRKGHHKPIPLCSPTPLPAPLPKHNRPFNKLLDKSFIGLLSGHYLIIIFSIIWHFH